MLDRVLPERVGAHIIFRSQQPQAVSRNEPEKRAFARADRTVTFNDFRDLSLDFENDLPTMAAPFVKHFVLFLPRAPRRKVRAAMVRGARCSILLGAAITAHARILPLENLFGKESGRQSSIPNSFADMAALRWVHQQQQVDSP
jgi:hypothetical protein